MKKKIAIMLSAVMAIGIVGSATVSTPTVVNAATTASADATQTAKFKNPVYDAETDTTNWDYAYFGMYPSTEIKGSELTKDIINADYEEDVSNMEVAQVNGVKYVRMTQGEANANSTPSGTLYGLDYTDEAFYNWKSSKSNYHYFKYEPIKWRVLEVSGDSVFLMADNALDCRTYSISKNSEKYTWSDSPMRVWLNGLSEKAANGYVCAGGGFLNTAFTKEEQNDIVTSNVHTEDNNLWGGSIKGGKDVQDKVFLLSVEETVNQDYGFAPDAMTLSSTRRIEPTDFAFAMGTWLGTEGKYYGNCWWMLRTPGDYQQKTALIYNTGQVYKEGYYVNTSYYGVVPALRVKADSTAVMTTAEYEQKYPQQTQKPNDDQTGDDQKKDDQTNNNQTDIKYGDIDGSDKVDLNDAKYALKYALGIKFDLSKIYVGKGDVSKIDLDKVVDVNADNKCDLNDAKEILKFALGITKALPIDSKTTAKAASVTAAETKTYEKYPASGVVWYAADSIAAQHDNKTSLAASSLTVKTRDTIGWGVIFNNYFTDANYRRFEEGEVIDTQFAKNTTDSAVVINNTALSSRSSKSFATEKNYEALTNGIGKGDYLFISFGHNDEYPQVERYADPYGDSSTEGSYKWYLKTKYIDVALEAGATPVLVSSVVKRNYIDGNYQPQFHAAYREAMIELVEEYAQQGITIPFIDLHSKMDELYQELTDEESKLLHASYNVAEFNDEGQKKVISILIANEDTTDMTDAEKESLATKKLQALSVEEVAAVVLQAAEELNSKGVSYINPETSASYMDNVHFTYAGARTAVKFVLDGIKDANLDLYDKVDEDAVKTLDNIEYTEEFKEAEIYNNVH